MMRTLNRYLIGQILVAFAMSLAVLCIVMVLGSVFRLLFPYIADGIITAWTAVKFILVILPFTLAFTIPWSFLTAVLLVFGRMSADSELVAIRGAGISFWRISAPVWALAGVFSFLCLLSGISWSPWAEKTSKSMLDEQILRNPEKLFRAQTPVEFAGFSIWTGNREGRTLENLYIFKSDRSHQVEQLIIAEKAEIVPQIENRKVILQMQNAYLELNEYQDNVLVDKRPTFAGQLSYDLDLSELYKVKFSPSQMTNKEIHQALKSGTAPGAGDKKKLSNELTKKQRRSLHFELHKRWSMALACFAFAAVAIPLGVTSQRRETSIGFVVSMGLALLYFLFLILAQTYRSQSALPYILLFLPNVLFLGIGVWLFVRLNRR